MKLEPVSYSIAPYLEQLVMPVDRSERGISSSPRSRFCRPCFTGRKDRGATIEDDVPSWLQRAMARSEHRAPLPVLEEELGDVTGHQDHVCLESIQLFISSFDPTQPVGVRLLACDVEHLT